MRLKDLLQDTDGGWQSRREARHPTCCLCVCPPREDVDNQTPGSM